jgi:hypothetical protein
MLPLHELEEVTEEDSEEEEEVEEAEEASEEEDEEEILPYQQMIKLLKKAQLLDLQEPKKHSELDELLYNYFFVKKQKIKKFYHLKFYFL